MKTIHDFWKELRKTQLKIQSNEREKRISIYDLYKVLKK